MTLHLASAFIVIYVTLRLIVPLALSRRVKAALILTVLVISQWHLYQRLFLGGLAATELPMPVLLAANWLFLSLAVLWPLLMARDFMLAAMWLLRRLKAVPPWPGSRNGRALALVGLAMIVAAFGLWQAVKAPQVRSMEVVLPGLPTELDGLSLAQISDLHASPLLKGPRVRRIVDMTNALKPDIIVLTGDQIDGSVEHQAEDVAPLADLRAPLGVLACVGNHEYYSGFDQWMAAFERLGINMLRNRHVVLEKNGARLVLAGITDRAARGAGRPLPDVAAAFNGAPAGLTKILLAHRPNAVPEDQLGGVDLHLSGHTHGGQLFLLAWPAKRRNDGYLSGWYKVGARQMYVSTGAGLWNGFPIRLGVPSEIVYLKLRSGPAAGSDSTKEKL